MTDPQDGKQPVSRPAHPGRNASHSGDSHSVWVPASGRCRIAAAPCFLPESGPGSPAQRTQWQILLLSLAALGLLALCRVTPEGDGITLLFAPGRPLPETCLTHRWTGLRCPGCGLTRSSSLVLQGQISQSLELHRCGWIAVLLLICQIPWRIWWIQVRQPSGSRLRQQVDQWSLALFAALLLCSRLWDAVVLD
ncbi:MAG: DUF2752 domain-containing protein [Planctomycetaceae bacterium]|nr:DUF2752 domain-containing protein [Planctomycetaceae bacterium]